MYLLYDVETLLFAIYPREMETYVHRETGAEIFIATMWIIKEGEQPKCPPTEDG